MRISRIFPFAIGVLLAGALASCSDDDVNAPVVVVDQNVADVHLASATYQSLTFEWNKVQGVNQYGYSLTDGSGLTVASGVTGERTITIESLATDAQYSFELVAYGATGEPSYRATVGGATLPIRALDAPTITATQRGNIIDLSWEPVDGAAAYSIDYTIADATMSILAVESTSCSISGLAPGDNTIVVTSLSDYPGYLDSEPLTVTVTRTRQEIATVTGKYTSGLIRRNGTWDATMHIYDDGSYCIDSFYQYEGYNLDFYVETGSPEVIGIYGALSYPDNSYFVVATGRASVPELDLIPGIIDGEYGATFTGDAAGGQFTITSRYGTVQGVDKFVW